jgi:hypothetical protein
MSNFYYEVHHKTEADQDHRIWLRRPLPNREGALLAFNAIARKEGLDGPFVFNESAPIPYDYVIIEREVMDNGLISSEQTRWPLRKYAGMPRRGWWSRQRSGLRAALAVLGRRWGGVAQPAVLRDKAP